MATHTNPKGRCIEGEVYKFPNIWLRPEDKCLSCQSIVHPLCGNISLEGDSYRCGPCHKHFMLTPIASVATEMEFTSRDTQNCLVSTATESTDTSLFKSIHKDYFITSDQHHNVVTQDNDVTM